MIFATLQRMLHLLFLLSVQPTQALAPSAVYTWIEESSSTAHAEFFHDYGMLSEDFHQLLQIWSTTQLKRSAKSSLTLHQQDKCTEGALFKSMNPKTVAPSGSELEQRFIESLFLIESSYCLPNVTLQKSYDVFMSKEFRLDVMPQVVGFTKNGSSSCVQSDGVTGILLPSEYCTYNRHIQDSQSIVVRTSLSSAFNDKAHQPLYFREEVIVFSQLSTGVAVYRATFSRSKDLGTTTKYLLRNTVSSSQSNIRDGYYEWLNKPQ